ncbi:DUF2269 family protein [Paeniglutamicibacter gangotriensis]|uniref:Putative integral membrane protein n=1 Tax=Paeniglutamicibacter gangotriensis Lz1y TaxID=1276920 RepID=M7MNH4_9MICC|nr:DUF2269 family protein [Paeniglutamicibacter gangotriensis]EMQ96601.1 putative integral membrane protein [Paeniglutamicibacter gangotriensis Lz1y]
MNTVFAVLHIAAAVFIVGPMAIMPMSTLRSLRGGDTVRVHASARSIRLLSYLSLIAFITGFGILGMVGEKWGLSVTTPWVLASVILYLVALLLTLAVVVPAFTRYDGRRTSSYMQASISSGIASIALIAVVVLMVWKP